LKYFYLGEINMKKQIIAAAVAATVSSVALADISITGAAKVNYTNVDVETNSTPDTNKFTQETDIKIKGKNGDTEVVVNFGGGGFDNTASTSDTRGSSTNDWMEVEDVYLTTKIADVTVKAGTWDNGNNELRASARNDGKFQASTSIGGLDLGFLTGSNGASQEEYTVGTDLGGVALSFTKKTSGETVKASTTIGGISLKYLGLPSDSANSDRNYVEASGNFGGMGVKVGKATADSATRLDGDTWLGDYEGNTSGDTMYLTDGQDITGVELSTSMAGNKVVFRNISVDDATTGGAAHDTDINKIIVTRPLASGATFELTYTDTDDKQSGKDTTSLDLELAVSF
jgi:hypothetical protein